MAFRIVKGDNNRETTIVYFYQDDVPTAVRVKRAEVQKLLNIAENQDKVTVKYGLLPQTKGEIAILTRSMLQMMITLSTLIEVPEDHVTRGLTPPIDNSSHDEEKELGRLVRIESGSKQPDDAFVSVKYLDHWFWISEEDFASKRTFTFLMLLFSMMENEKLEGLPLVTIPAG